jgi:hypothetical protein
MTRRANHAPLDIEVIRAKSIEEGDCWLWQGALNQGVPVVRHAGQIINVRRYIAQHLHGKAVQGKLASTTCRNPQCCAPEHVDLITRKQLQIRTTKRTRHQSRASRNEKLAARARARSSALDQEAVAAIRASDLTGRELAEQYGVALSTVQHARNYRSWKDYRSPFAGLMK